MSEQELKSAPKHVIKAYSNLTAKQKAFALAVPMADTMIEAGRMAGYTELTAWKKSRETSEKPDVKIVIDYLRGIQMQAAKDSIERMIEELLRIALADPRQVFDENGAVLPMSKWPDDISRAVSSIDSFEVKKNGETVGVVKKIRFAGKTDAIDKISRIRGFYRPEKHEVTGADGQPLVSLLEQITGSAFPVSDGKKGE